MHKLGSYKKKCKGCLQVWAISSHTLVVLIDNPVNKLKVFNFKKIYLKSFSTIWSNLVITENTLTSTSQGNDKLV